MNDLGAVVWKEWRELSGERGLRGKLGSVAFIAVFGIVLPLQAGPEWVTSPVTAIAWAWAPMFLITTVIADAVAGERERHTLETLLATRLTDRAILLGKILASVVHSGIVTAASLLCGVITVNVAHASDAPLLYSAGTLAVIGALGALGGIFIASLGVLVSLRSPTVRQAQQALGGAIMLLLVAPMLLVRVLPGDLGPQEIAKWIAGGDFVVAACLVLGTLAAGTLALALNRFRRHRLILD